MFNKMISYFKTPHPNWIEMILFQNKLPPTINWNNVELKKDVTNF